MTLIRSNQTVAWIIAFVLLVAAPTVADENTAFDMLQVFTQPASSGPSNLKFKNCLFNCRYNGQEPATRQYCIYCIEGCDLIGDIYKPDSANACDGLK